MHNENPKSIKCDECEKSFKYKKELEVHSRSIHMKDLKKEFRCEKCDREFRFKEEVKKHERAVMKSKEIIIVTFAKDISPETMF